MRNDQATDAERWVDRHGDSLYRYALARLRRPELAADLVQDTFLEALRAWGTFSGRSSERTWLVGILKHKIVDHFRKSGREPGVANGVPLPREPAEGSAFDHRGHWKIGPASWAGEPSRDIETREFWDVFRQCLGRLPPEVADTFSLRAVDGLNAEEVREILGITPANLWARLYRARAILRQCLEIHWFGRRPAALPGKGPPLS